MPLKLELGARENYGRIVGKFSGFVAELGNSEEKSLGELSCIRGP